jgi:cytochrome c-type protein NapB
MVAQFVETTFKGYAPSSVHGDRLYPGAPPVVPHWAFMRENCLACHAGPAARPEIRCTHADRTNCRQCHVQTIEDHWPESSAWQWTQLTRSRV